MNKENAKIPLWKGVIASAVLVTFYFTVLTLVNSFSYAASQFFSYWYLMIPLVLGFGFQVALYSYITSFPKHANAGGKVAATGSVSGISMVACCLHLIAPLIPLIGFSGAMVFLSEYSTGFLVIGLFSNLLGIFIMLGVTRQQGVHAKNSLLKNISASDVRLGKIFTVAIAVMIIPFTFVTAETHGMTGTTTGDYALETLTDNSGGLTVTVTPQMIDNGEAVFSVALDTHQGDLGFHVEDVTVLIDDKGNEYTASSWEGSPPGGHHRNGELIFTGINKDATKLTLVVKNLYGVPERVFEWDL